MYFLEFDYSFNVCAFVETKIHAIIMEISWCWRCFLLHVTGFRSYNEQYKRRGCYYKHLW